MNYEELLERDFLQAGCPTCCLSNNVAECRDIQLNVSALYFLNSRSLISTSLGEESPPLPVAQLQVCRAVSLDNANCNQLVTTLLEMSE